MASDDKYDRQVRVWEASGQVELRNSKLVLLNATSAGSETLKNVVLAGCKSITIIDDHICTDVDVESNFFVHNDDIGKRRAEVVLRNLVELNPDVLGFAPDVSVDQVLCNDHEFISDNDIVVVDLPSFLLLDFSKSLRKRGIPLLQVRNYGLLSTVRLLSKHLFTLDTQDSEFQPSYELSNPFPSLRHLVDTVRLEHLQKSEHSHVPYFILLIKAFDIWSSENGNSKRYCVSDKKRIIQILNDLRFDSSSPSEINFDEAIENVKHLTHSVPDHLVNFLEKPFVSDERESLMYVVHKVLSEFWKKYHRVPISSSIPDMHSSTEMYTRLKACYEEESAQDSKRIEDILKVLDLNIPLSEIMSSLKSPQRICHYHIADIDCELDLSLDSSLRANLRNNILGHSDETPSSGCFFVALLAADAFFRTHHRYPGDLCGYSSYFYSKYPKKRSLSQNETDPEQLFSLDSDTEEYERLVIAEFEKLLGTPLPPELDLKNIASEMIRYGGLEVGVNAALIGGVASQEIFKIITRKFEPIAGLFVHCSVINKSDVVEALVDH